MRASIHRPLWVSNAGKEQGGYSRGWGGPGGRYEVVLQGGKGVKVQAENLEWAVCGGSEMNWETFDLGDIRG